MIMAWRDREGWLNYVFCDDGREREMGDEDGNDMEDMSGYEKSGVRPASFSLEHLVSVFLLAGSEVVPAVSVMENWPAHRILLSPSFSSWFRPSPLISLFLYHHLRTWSEVIPIYLSMQWSFVNAKYSIHRGLHTPSTASSRDWLCPAPSQLSSRRTSLYSTLYIPTIKS